MAFLGMTMRFPVLLSLYGYDKGPKAPSKLLLCFGRLIRVGWPLTVLILATPAAPPAFNTCHQTSYGPRRSPMYTRYPESCFPRPSLLSFTFHLENVLT